jgi:hypothetical protein
MSDEKGEQRRSVNAAHQPLDPDGASPGPSSPAASPEAGLTITPNKNRLLQVRRTAGRKLFDRAAKETFLEWFAATCNVRLSAAKTGVCEKTIYKHLLKDEPFLEGFRRALRLGYLRLEARSLQGALPSAVRDASSPQPPPSVSNDQFQTVPGSPAQSLPLSEEYEVRVLDSDLVEEHFDPQLALQLLREHARRLPGTRERQRTTARAATNKEVAEALAKRLKGFALRIRQEPILPEAGRSCE